MAGAADPAEVEEEAAAGVGRGSACTERYIYLEPTRCTLNSSPRGQVTLFFFLQYGQIAVRATCLPNPVEPTIRMPR